MKIHYSIKLQKFRPDIKILVKGNNASPDIRHIKSCNIEGDKLYWREYIDKYEHAWPLNELEVYED